MLINPIFPRGIKAGKSLPFYFILKVPFNAVAGEYNANVKIDIGNQSYEVPVTLTVWDFDIPLKHSIRTAYGEDYRILLGNTIENLVHLSNSGSNDAGYTDTSAIDAVQILDIPGGGGEESSGCSCSFLQN
jgi:hypothetical protein